MTPAAARALLAGLVDYAGLFPPAAFDMEAAAAEYARWLRAPEAFMLRFVAPADASSTRPPRRDSAPEPAGEPWRERPPRRTSTATVRASHRVPSHSGRATVDSVELKARARKGRRRLVTLPGSVAFVELPLAGDGAQLAVLKQRGARAKLRTGGVVPGRGLPTWPDSRRQRGRRRCVQGDGRPSPSAAGGARSATGGQPHAVMHGFLNVFAGRSPSTAAPPRRSRRCCLQTRAFVLDAGGPPGASGGSPPRRSHPSAATSATSFGSCSFAEPVADLALQVLQ